MKTLVTGLLTLSIFLTSVAALAQVHGGTPACEEQIRQCQRQLPRTIHDLIQPFCETPAGFFPSLAQTGWQCVRQIPEPLRHLIRGVAHSARERQLFLSERIHECQVDPGYRELLESSTPMAKGSEGKWPCSTLVTEWDEALRHQRHQDLETKILNQRFLTPERSSSDADVLASARENPVSQIANWLGVEKAKLECLKAEELASLWCYRAFFITDPVVVAGMSLRAHRLAKALATDASEFIIRRAVDRAATEEARLISQLEKAAILARPVPRNPQVVLWKLREEGHLAAARSLEEQIAFILREGHLIKKPERVTGASGAPLGQNDAMWIELEGGVRALWKPSRESGGMGAAYEAAAYRIDRHLGLNSVPVVVEKRSIEGVEGSVHLRVEDLHPRTIVSGQPRSTLFFDYLMANEDRFELNLLMTREGRPVMIDQGRSFYELGGADFPDFIRFRINASKTPHSLSTGDAGFLPRPVRRMDGLERARYLAIRELQDLGLRREVVDRLRQTNADQWKQILGSSLGPYELQLIMARQRSLLTVIDEAEATFGPAIFVSGPFTPVEFFSLKYLRPWE